VGRNPPPAGRSGPPARRSLESLREPTGTARDRLPRDALQRVTALINAQTRKLAFVAASLCARIGAVLAERQRRGRHFRRRVRDAEEREVDVREATPQTKRVKRRERHAAERHASARTRRGGKRDRLQCAGRHIRHRRAAIGRQRDRATVERARGKRQRKDDVAADERITRRQRLDLDPREVAERMQQCRRHQSAEHERDAESERQRVVERREHASLADLDAQRLIDGGGGANSEPVGLPAVGNCGDRQRPARRKRIVRHAHAALANDLVKLAELCVDREQIARQEVAKPFIRGARDVERTAGVQGARPGAGTKCGGEE